MRELRRNRRGRSFYGWAARGMAVCAAGLMFLLSGITGWAARTGTVRINDVNVRAEADTESQRVCKLPINTSVNIVDEKTGSDEKTWYSVSFTYEGEETTGWIRSDMLTVSETEDPAEGGEEPSEGSGGGYTIIEPEESREADYLTQIEVSVNGEGFTGWMVDMERTEGKEIYLVYAQKDGEGAGWYYFDPGEETFQRDVGQFAGGSEPEGLISSLQEELTGLKEQSQKKLSQRLYIIIGLGALSAILLILVIVFAVKARNADYEYYDEDEEDDEDEEILEKPKRRWGRKVETEEDEEDDFDDFVKAAKRKQSSEDWLTEEEDEEDTEEKPDLSLTANLPEIDMSAVLAVEEEAEEAGKKKTVPQKKEQVQESAEEDFADFDIEILDFDDLDLS